MRDSIYRDDYKGEEEIAGGRILRLAGVRQRR
jgi:hypothetical protein